MSDQNRCVVCGIDMGECNPRQYCCKTYCSSEPCLKQKEKNRCVVCGIDMGECNPRQYCCKTYCPKQND